MGDNKTNELYKKLESTFNIFLIDKLKNKKYKLKYTNKLSVKNLTFLGCKAWVKYINFVENKNDENLFDFLNQYIKFVCDEKIEDENNKNKTLYREGIITLYKRNHRLAIKTYKALKANKVSVKEMSLFFNQILYKYNSPFFEYEKLY